MTRDEEEGVGVKARMRLLLVTFCDTTAGIGGSFQTHRKTDTRSNGQTDVEVEIVI